MSALKEMYNRRSVGELAAAIQRAYPPFDTSAMMERVFDREWPGRELKARMRHITTVLGDLLPPSFPEALDILRQVPPALTGQGFEKMVFPDFVEVYGLDDYEASMPALEFFTQHISAEFAVRPFIDRYPQQAMAQMLRWAGHEHPGVRRLASEGCRPRLPWAMALPALKADPSPILPILEKLKDDESESVRRSVANNLNDISKDNPDVVIETLRRWQTDDCEEVGRITSHALRTLLKQGHPAALELLGYPPNPEVKVENVSLESAAVPIGGEIIFAFDVISTGDQPQNLMVDYIVHHMRANGRQTPKVFKLTKRTIEPGERLHIERRHSFRPVTTRKYYPGLHAIQPHINGQAFQRLDFELLEA